MNLRTLLVVAFGAFAFSALALPLPPKETPGESCYALLEDCTYVDSFGMPEDYTGGGSSTDSGNNSLCAQYQRYAASTGEAAGGDRAGRGAAAGVAILLTIFCLAEKTSGDLGTSFLPAWR